MYINGVRKSSANGWYTFSTGSIIKIYNLDYSAGDLANPDSMQQAAGSDGDGLRPSRKW